MDGSKAEAPAYTMQPVDDARGGDSGWMIGGIWAGILIITALICMYAALPISGFEGGTWPGDVYTVWRITPARITITLLMYALAGALQRWTLRNWLPLSRWWIASVVGGHGLAQVAEYQIDHARPDFDAEIIAQGNLPIGLGWILAAVLQALLLRRFSRRAWEWLAPPLVAMALAWLGLDVLAAIAYLLLGAVALVRLLRSAPDQPLDLG